MSFLYLYYGRASVCVHWLISAACIHRAGSLTWGSKVTPIGCGLGKRAVAVVIHACRNTRSMRRIGITASAVVALRIQRCNAE
jgi:hypothetical protein